MSAPTGVRLSSVLGRDAFFRGLVMPAVSKKISFAFDIGDRVWMVCEPRTSGFVTGYRISQGFLPAYIVSTPDDETICQSYEITAEEPVDYPASED